MPGRIQADDLPPALKKQLGLKNAGRMKPRPSRIGQGAMEEGPGTCHACGESFDSYGAWEKHSQASGHSRFDAALSAT